MKVQNQLSTIFRSLCLLIGLSLLMALFTSLQAQTGQKAPGFAVLELFTSEGCSSCPPAENLLAKIHAQTKGQPVYVLAYHVDYWDRAGWKDRFSQHSFSLRQYAYSSSLSAQVYTPQLVINGLTQGIGSEEPFVRDAIAKALAEKAKATMEMTLDKATAGAATVTYAVQGQVSGTRLEIALLQKQAVSQVRGGENKGRSLIHKGIVRALETYELSGHDKGTVRIALPAGFNKDAYDVIGFLQLPGSGAIIAAAPVLIRD
ncbi:hypothetical protein SAMN05192529_11830 [Arachidicoccus rhizosphaerae]|uniref:DUF1223 domain-containing protein n=1 Tax=Arachidicoccus rhizosphaerae TaxID=551991 RepID=A0A1H4B4L2_9BACT|nr:DUF1223 domain-containing protein [Arachidicoccus rhizosphaerae]SEA42812.1 hypothetical protein SAMN05192529_11830 [Arachidicoccus rhizosphaerae]